MLLVRSFAAVKMHERHKRIAATHPKGSVGFQFASDMLKQIKYRRFWDATHTSTTHMNQVIFTNHYKNTGDWPGMWAEVARSLDAKHTVTYNTIARAESTAWTSITIDALKEEYQLFGPGDIESTYEGEIIDCFDSHLQATSDDSWMTRCLARDYGMRAAPPG